MVVVEVQMELSTIAEQFAETLQGRLWCRHPKNLLLMVIARLMKLGFA